MRRLIAQAPSALFLKQIEAILFKKSNGGYEFLLLKRTPSRGGFWQPVTGGVKEEESLENALYREIDEETGLTSGQVRRVVKLEEANFSFQKSSIHFDEYPFGVEIISNSKIIRSHEHTEYRWCKYNEALKLLYWETNKKALMNLQKKLSTSSCLI